MADDTKTKKKAKRKKKVRTAQARSNEIVAADSETEQGAEAQSVVTVTTAELNQAMFGELVLHFPERDVVLMLDGATAARVIASFAEPRRRARLQDRISTQSSLMSNLWSSFDLARLLGVSWIPGLPSKATDRMTVDPPLPS